MDESILKGFSKYTKQQRIVALILKYGFQEDLASWLANFENSDSSIQKIIDDLSENPISSFHFPFSIAPNFLVNGKKLFFPLVSEESSVVAALSNAAGFWAKRGGFHAEVLGTEKKGQVHFIWKGNPENLQAIFSEIKNKILAESALLTAKMEERGGGITGIELKSLPHILPNYFQLDAGFETCDAMGANFINSCLEQFGKSLLDYFETIGLIDQDKFLDGGVMIETLIPAHDLVSHGGFTAREELLTHNINLLLTELESLKHIMPERFETITFITKGITDGLASFKPKRS